MTPRSLKVISLAKQGEYLYARVPGHPHATKDDYVLQHRFVMEQKLGRFLRADEVVHHKDENKRNNKIRNLEVKKTEAHNKLHGEERRVERVRLTCAQCGVVVKRLPSQLPGKRGLKRTFCSHSCNAKFYRKNTGKLVHGTVSGYTNYDCRCVLCREAQRLAVRKWRASKSLSRNR